MAVPSCRVFFFFFGVGAPRPPLSLVSGDMRRHYATQVEVELPSSSSGGADSDGADVDVDDLDSDVDCMEGLDGEVVAVRTWALEEQATACQMILLLAEALQVWPCFLLLVMVLLWRLQLFVVVRTFQLFEGQRVHR